MDIVSVKEYLGQDWIAVQERFRTGQRYCFAEFHQFFDSFSVWKTAEAHARPDDGEGLCRKGC